MIDWEHVKIGETVVVSPNNKRRIVLGLDGDEVWMKGLQYAEYHSYPKHMLTDWTIEDPWEDITAECSIDHNFNVKHQGVTLVGYIDGGRCRARGMRVFRKKEGMP